MDIQSPFRAAFFFFLFTIPAHLSAQRPTTIVWPLEILRKGPPTAVSVGVASKGHYTKLVVPKKQTMLVDGDSLYVDTLVMGDKSTLKFTKPLTFITVEHAFIGSNCAWFAAGLRGKNGSRSSNPYSTEVNGTDGSPGNSIFAAIGFHTLGNLAINTKGGGGGQGIEGRPGVSQSRTGAPPLSSDPKGEDGGLGGNGADGGNLTLYYYGYDFLVVFNDQREHSIALDYTGGKGGRGGRGGLGGILGERATSGYQAQTRGSSGLTGYSGKEGKNGSLILERLNLK